MGLEARCAPRHHGPGTKRRLTSRDACLIAQLKRLLRQLDGRATNSALTRHVAGLSEHDNFGCPEGRTVLLAPTTRGRSFPERTPRCPSQGAAHEVCVREETSGYLRSVTRASTCAVAPGPRISRPVSSLSMAGFEWPSTTSLRAVAPGIYRARYPVAYGHRRTQTGAPRLYAAREGRRRPPTIAGPRLLPWTFTHVQN